MNTRRRATLHLQSRIRQTDGVPAIVSRSGVVIAEDITIVKMDVTRLVRNESDTLVESDEAAFLVGADDLPDDPEVGDLYTVDGIEYRVAERVDTEMYWRWHDKSRIQRIVFCNEWADE